MKTLVKSLMVSVLAIAMAAFTPEALFAQARRSSTGSSGSSAARSSNTTSVSSSNERSSSSASVSRSSASAASQQQSRSSASAASQQSSGSRSAAQQSNESRRSAASSSASSASTSRSSASAASSGSSSGTSTTSRRSASGSQNASASESRAAQSSQSSSSASRRSASGSAGREATSINSNDLGKVSQTSRRSASAATSKGLSPVSESPAASQQASASRSKVSNYGGRESAVRLDNHEVLRIPPRERERVMDWDVPAHYYTREPHYFGYRIHSLPPRPHKMVHWGRTYYYYNNVYYRPWGSGYVVCRPPYGVCVERAMVNAALRNLRFAYYHNAYYTYREIDANYRTIDEQNRIIARNNATIAAQNAAMALNAGRAYSAYELANQLGLVQSYANAATNYYYEDGVFFTVNARGQYEVIVPPAGALVSELPDDYETLVMNGIEYYMVDNTVFRLTLVDGEPFLEVLGQMPGRIAKQYGYNGYYYY